MRRQILIRSAVIAVGLMTIASVCSMAFGADAPVIKASSATPMLAVVEQFSAANIPAKGPNEADPMPRNWAEPASAPEVPGNGIAQHPMLYAGEGHNTLFVVNNGKVVWTYSTGPGGEIDDVWMLTNGHIVYAKQTFIEELTPQKEVVWHFDAPKGTEIHTCQPMGLDKVMFVQNDLPPKVMVYDKTTKSIKTINELPAESLTDPKTVHAQFRRVRVTAKGTYLAAFLKMNKVVEFDKDMKPIWTYEIPTPWDAKRLQNGNTLITNEREKLVREVNPKGETVWEFKQSELPANIVQKNTQTADRLANGNTVIFSCTGGTKPADRPTIIQAVEVTPDKNIVWVLQDWKNLGPATTAQFLDQPGIPEQPGDLQH
jgi:hypothetical protein